MTSLADLLADPRVLTSRLKAGCPEPTALRRAVSALDGREGEAGSLEQTAALQARIADAARRNALSAISRRDLREGCKVYLHPPSAPGRTPDVGEPLIDEVGRLRRRAAFFALIDAYIDGFAADDVDVGRMAARIRSLAETWPWRDSDEWQDRATEFALFDPREAPARLAAAVLSSDEPARVVLDRAGLNTDSRRKGGMSEAAFRAACQYLVSRTGPSTTPLQVKIIEWARDGTGGLQFPRAWPEFVEATLLPWRDHEPEAAHKAALVSVLEQFGGGDPRTQPARWRVVETRTPLAFAVLLRWLTRASVMQFLDIVERSLREPDAKRMWAYRRAFWTSYLLGTDGGPTIEQAWVAFGDDGARLARDTARSSGDRTFATFGRQVEKSSQHAALVMVIGDLLVVDWSHSGKYNVWRRGEPGRPQLYKNNYAFGELDSAPHRDSHVAAAHFTWQKKLAEIIEGRRFWSEKPSWRPRRV